MRNERVVLHRPSTIGSSTFSSEGIISLISKPVIVTIHRSCNSSNSSGSEDASPDKPKTPFGYSRKDVILIGVGVTAAGIGLKSGLEYFGVDPLQAGNVVQLVLVLGLTIGWISTYIFRVSNKEMTYAQQLRDYERKVIEVTKFSCGGFTVSVGLLHLVCDGPVVVQFIQAPGELDSGVAELSVKPVWEREVLENRYYKEF